MDPLNIPKEDENGKNDDYIYNMHILNGMFESLFDIYEYHECAKDMWDAVESKYMAKDASSKKFIICNFYNYEMVDSRSVMKYYNELIRIFGQSEQHKI